jgi:calcineurin-like phosphoesterase family protein
MQQDPELPKFYFSSDFHFLHDKAFIFEKRGCSSVEEMNEKIIENFNKIIRPQDYLIVLGDIFLGNKTKAKEYISRLNGHKINVRGNHDFGKRKMLNMGFEWVCDKMELNIQGTPVLLSHYPYQKNLLQKIIYRILAFFDKNLRIDSRKFEQAPVDRGMFLLCGHTHQLDKVRGRQINVGLDAWQMRPVSEDEIASLINKIKPTKQNPTKLNFKKVIKKLIKNLNKESYEKNTYPIVKLETDSLEEIFKGDKDV